MEEEKEEEALERNVERALSRVDCSSLVAHLGATTPPWPCGENSIKSGG